MSAIEIDDLVASLSKGAHIGQEAIDLSNLHAQLSQALFHFQSAAPAHGYPSAHHASVGYAPGPSNSAYAPSNTPTANTPVSSTSWASTMAADLRRKRSLSCVRQRREIDIMEEESVERELFPSAPQQYYSSHSCYPSNPPTTPQIQRHPAPTSAGPFPYESTTSTFASQDPFYAAQLQASAQHQTGTSFFAQAGALSPKSPFFVASQASKPIPTAQLERMGRR